MTSGEYRDRPLGEPAQYQASLFIDTLTGQHIVGRAALDACIEAGGHPSDIKDLAEALVDDSIALPEKNHRAKRNSFNRDAAITDGRFLVNLIHAYDTELTVTARVMERAFSVGAILHSPSQIRKPATFGSFVNFQKAVGESNLYQKSHFDHLTFKDLVEHIKKIGAQEGGKPTIHTIDKRVDEDELDEPSSRIIRRLIAPLTFFDLYEAAGWCETTHNWSNERYELFGVSYMWANQGRVPSAAALEALRKKRTSPSVQGTYGRYDSLSQYQDVLITRFNKMYEELAGEMEAGIMSGIIPIQIISGVKTEWQSVVRYIKYELISGVLTAEHTSSQLVAVVKAIGTMPDIEFSAQFPGINVNALKQVARNRGVEGAIWPKASGLYRKEKRRSTAKVAQPQNGTLQNLRDWRKRTIRQNTQHTRRLKIKLGRPGQQEAEDYLRQRGEEIKLALTAGEVPVRLFNGVSGGKEMVKRFEAYSLVTSLLPNTSVEDKVRLAILSTSTKALADQLRKQNVNTTDDLIEELALAKGFAAI